MIWIATTETPLFRCFHCSNFRFRSPLYVLYLLKLRIELTRTISGSWISMTSGIISDAAMDDTERHSTMQPIDGWAKNKLKQELRASYVINLVVSIWCFSFLFGSFLSNGACSDQDEVCCVNIDIYVLCGDWTLFQIVNVSNRIQLMEKEEQVLLRRHTITHLSHTAEHIIKQIL